MGVTARTTSLLHVVLQRIGNVIVDNQPYVFFVHSHPKGGGGHNSAYFIGHKVVGGIGKVAKKALWLPGKIAKGVINAPFAAMRGIATSITGAQVRKGSADNMSAKERIAFRARHPFRTGADMGQFSTADDKLVDMKASELKVWKNVTDVALNARKKMGQKIGELSKKAGEYISEFFNQPSEVNTNYSRYNLCGTGKISAIHRAVSEGKLNNVIKILTWLVKKGKLSETESSEFLNGIKLITAQIYKERDNLANVRDLRSKAFNNIKKQFGVSGFGSVRKLKRLLNKEYDVKSAEEAEAKAKGEADAARPENVVKSAIEIQSEKVRETMTGISDQITSIIEGVPSITQDQTDKINNQIQYAFDQFLKYSNPEAYKKLKSDRKAARKKARQEERKNHRRGAAGVRLRRPRARHPRRDQKRRQRGGGAGDL